MHKSWSVTAMVIVLMTVELTHADVFDDIMFPSIPISDEGEDGEEGGGNHKSSNLLFEKHTDGELQSFYDSFWTQFEFNKTRQVSFEWSDCGGKSDAGRINSVTLSPDPLTIPGQVTLGFEFQLNTKIAAPLSLDLEIKMKIGFIWVTVKTFNYPDFCAIIGQVTCPTKFPNCHCPYNNGIYTLPPSIVQVTQGGVPGGEYQVTGRFKQNNIEIGCVWAQLNVS